jgi:hypothetical protein
MCLGCVMGNSVYANIELVPFAVPECVMINVPVERANDDYLQYPTIPLDNLSPSELEKLAALWLNNLFASVGRANPFEIPNG